MLSKYLLRCNILKENGLLSEPDINSAFSNIYFVSIAEIEFKIHLIQSVNPIKSNGYCYNQLGESIPI